MSGRSLFPLTIEMCNRISRQFNGKMRISFAGGAEFFNCDKLFSAGIWPITVATTILKPGGYNRLHRWSKRLRRFPTAPSAAPTQAPSATCPPPATRISIISSPSSLSLRESPRKKYPGSTASPRPARGGCPIHQDIPEYMELCRKGLYGPALKLITEKNALPFITGTICAHRCPEQVLA